ncbi:MAG: rod shape-determining protein MreD [Firmicutes bacterium]|nr:rod shape-determining protein MreD [Bacillota bacterium]MCM1401167.1 rod shape-determining protein MreD [Bacteroides sp.]MCM1477713.1 rod shape-determining protein MreD [Bacteroides sp.]
MNKSSLQILTISVVLVLVQVIVLNRICLFGVAVPLAFIYVILRLPISMAKEWLFTIAFVLGFIVDVFSDTAGINTLSCLVIAALRGPVLHLYFPREDELSNPLPSIATLGPFVYFKYALTLAFIYCLSVFFLESFSMFRFWHLVQCVLASTVLTTALLIGIDSITLPRREKRL